MLSMERCRRAAAASAAGTVVRTGSSRPRHLSSTRCAASEARTAVSLDLAVADRSNHKLPNHAHTFPECIARPGARIVAQSKMLKIQPSAKQKLIPYFSDLWFQPQKMLSADPLREQKILLHLLSLIQNKDPAAGELIHTLGDPWTQYLTISHRWSLGIDEQRAGQWTRLGQQSASKRSPTATSPISSSDDLEALQSRKRITQSLLLRMYSHMISHSDTPSQAHLDRLLTILRDMRAQDIRIPRRVYTAFVQVLQRWGWASDYRLFCRTLQSTWALPESIQAGILGQFLSVLISTRDPQAYMAAEFILNELENYPEPPVDVIFRGWHILRKPRRAIGFYLLAKDRGLAIDDKHSIRYLLSNLEHLRNNRITLIKRSPRGSSHRLLEPVVSRATAGYSYRNVHELLTELWDRHSDTIQESEYSTAFLIKWAIRNQKSHIAESMLHNQQVRLAARLRDELASSPDSDAPPTATTDTASPDRLPAHQNHQGSASSRQSEQHSGDFHHSTRHRKLLNEKLKRALLQSSAQVEQHLAADSLTESTSASAGSLHAHFAENDGDGVLLESMNFYPLHAALTTTESSHIGACQGAGPDADPGPNEHNAHPDEEAELLEAFSSLISNSDAALETRRSARSKLDETWRHVDAMYANLIRFHLAQKNTAQFWRFWTQLLDDREAFNPRSCSQTLLAATTGLYALRHWDHLYRLMDEFRSRFPSEAIPSGCYEIGIEAMARLQDPQRSTALFCWLLDEGCPPSLQVLLTMRNLFRSLNDSRAAIFDTEIGALELDRVQPVATIYSEF
ncbi:uncharacterized protein BJ171DRAFT_501464 [Polychytrium aggregatum]|uniref:uncharacterized protein n=1 Tax=Polychytrium aggregatum TaxID=110093 RepID=UPI0022FF21DE|nr:uncharacterized protein BJ171DRAFT_501464 [Polychytrium aggregatum]KAI9205238.1 hypothetical protein BJ171DRAFT_501464 [Polychytrium aggregatum]